ncbi:MAG TPA: ABC transporter permease [Rhodocyclaceae bacterium]|nr:MAG: ABC transporter permease [Betaproteobacteria bacterium CG2_30_68_42]PIX75721.1 MAG: ABC transporter permease [Rhodocyclales bacterium CG_4_10_14_3_um_filter_68_10]PJA58078.1 MAG: ABC transporter permease [Rhodocyclales bacterium CG_4_9_14_3_um_filter_68_10]HCX33725.1 ABC transporter permease [Rhodocyclaceae bacterium]
MLRRTPTKAEPVQAFLTDLRVALRNLVRQRRRAAIAVSAILFGVIALLLAGGFIEWILWSLREGSIRSHLGHVQIMRPGYLKAGAASPFDYLMPSRPELENRIGALPGVRAMGPRMSFSGLASHGDSTISFIGEAVDPEKEHIMSRLVKISKGDELSIHEPRGIIMGMGLAKSMGVGVGDTVVLMAGTASGGINAVECRIRGLFFTVTKAYDDSALRMPIATARELLRVAGSHVWVVLLEKTEDTPAVLRQMRATTTGADIAFVPWWELAGTYQQTVTLFKRQVGVMELIIGIIIVLSISNTLMMSVMERTGEIGTAMALGIRRSRVLRQFLIEGTMLGVVGGAAGVLIGWPLALIVSWIGIPMPPPPGVSVPITAEIFVNAPLAAEAFALAFLTTAVASLYPAWKASRMEIVNALRFNR